MLTLTMSPNDYLMIGDNIIVKFIGGSKNNYKIAVDAPKEYSIVRSKVYQKEVLDKAQQELKDLEQKQSLNSAEIA